MPVNVKYKRFPILVAEHWARSWSRCTGSQPAGDLKPSTQRRLPLLSDWPAFTFTAEEHHCPSAGTKLYCLVTEANACKQLAQGCYLEADRPKFEHATFWITSKHCTFKPHRPVLRHILWKFTKIHSQLFLCSPDNKQSEIGMDYFWWGKKKSLHSLQLTEICKY